jgi:hypothetical protein
VYEQQQEVEAYDQMEMDQDSANLLQPQIIDGM